MAVVQLPLSVLGRLFRPPEHWRDETIVDPVRVQFARRPSWPSPGVLEEHR